MTEKEVYRLLIPCALGVVGDYVSLTLREADQLRRLGMIEDTNAQDVQIQNLKKTLNEQSKSCNCG